MKLIYTALLLFISLNLSAQVPPYKVIVNNGAPGGYYFVAPLVFNTSIHHSFYSILDSTGSIVYYKPFLNSQVYGFKLQDNGLISYFNTALNDFTLEDSTFTPLGQITARNGYSNDVHEMQILPNGHYLLLVQEKPTMDLSSYLYFNGNGSPGSATATVICAVIQELDQNKNVVFEWHAKDHLSFDSVDPFFMSSPTTVDWTHSNALALANDGNILMSSRHLDQIIKINRQDSSVMWRFGGKYNDFTFIGDTVPFYGQHDIRQLSNGHYTLYDDGNHTIPHGARALEYELDEVNMTARLVWSYVYDSTMASGALGSVQRLASSATVIDYGDILKNAVCFNVVDSSGGELFRLTYDGGEASYRAFNYPQLPWSWHRPQLSCFQSNDTLFLDAGSGYSSYRWNNGDSTRIIAVTTPDTFSVFVPYGQGGFISSEKMIVTDTHSSACTTTSLSEAPSLNNSKIFPNPAHDQINICCGSSENHVPPYIQDLSGRIISIPEKGNDLINHAVNYDVSSLANGFYMLTINGQTFKFIKN